MKRLPTLEPMTVWFCNTTAHIASNVNSTRTGVDRVAGLYVTGSNGSLVASAGRDLNIVSGVVANAGISGIADSTAARTGTLQRGRIRSSTKRGE